MMTVLTIAGFDPSSGAGISADLKVFAAHGLYGTACITALTVQNTLGVAATHPISADTITATLQNLQGDLPSAGIKIGMLATPEAVSATAAFLREIRQEALVPVVLDPVFKSSSGKHLLNMDGIERLRKELLPIVDWITPNLDETAVLLERDLIAPAEISQAAAKLQRLGTGLTVVVTGGHQIPPNDLVLQPNSLPHVLVGQYIASSAIHGTGCAFSSALLSRLVLGDAPMVAAQAAKEYVATAIRLAGVIGHGHGPLNHLWPLQRRASTPHDPKRPS